jgi:arginine-tRNA-protein transferase
MLYQELMDAGFRRSGTFFYQPICRGCRQCRPIRVPVGRFAPSKSQRRTWRRNQDLVVAVGAPVPTDEKFDLYTRYLRQRHHNDEAEDPASFVEFLYRSPVRTLEMTYRDGRGRLIGVGICDLCERSLSSVYFYFDPDEARRGPGTFSSLWEIDFARRRSVPYYYLGYWVSQCASMAYKANYRPTELLGDDGVWRSDDGEGGGGANLARSGG